MQKKPKQSRANSYSTMPRRSTLAPSCRSVSTDSRHRRHTARWIGPLPSYRMFSDANVVACECTCCWALRSAPCLASSLTIPARLLYTAPCNGVRKYFARQNDTFISDTLSRALASAPLASSLVVSACMPIPAVRCNIVRRSCGIKRD